MLMTASAALSLLVAATLGTGTGSVAGTGTGTGTGTRTGTGAGAGAGTGTHYFSRELQMQVKPNALSISAESKRTYSEQGQAHKIAGDGDDTASQPDLAASRRSSSVRALYTLGPSASTTLSSFAIALAFFLCSLVVPGAGGVKGGCCPKPLAAQAPLPPACMQGNPELPSYDHDPACNADARNRLPAVCGGCMHCTTGSIIARTSQVMHVDEMPSKAQHRGHQQVQPSGAMRAPVQHHCVAYIHDDMK